MFSVKFAKFIRKTILKNTCERLLNGVKHNPESFSYAWRFKKIASTYLKAYILKYIIFVFGLRCLLIIEVAKSLNEIKAKVRNCQGKCQNSRLREKGSYWEFFWSIFSHIGTEYGKLLCKSHYSVVMRQNMFTFMNPFQANVQYILKTEWSEHWSEIDLNL